MATDSNTSSSSDNPTNKETLKDTNISHENGNEKKALIASVSSYNTLRPLDFCKKDGEEIYSILQNLGYQISSDNTLLGGEVKYDRLRKSLINFFTDSSIRSKDTLLFYFSGHGIPDGEGDTYIALSDTDPDRPYEHGISFDDLTKFMNRSISKRVVMILDCCCSGAAKITKGSEDEAANLTRSAMDEKSKKLRQGEGKYLLAASLAAQAAYNMKKEDHSLFTYYLIDGLKGANGETVDKDGYVTPETLGSYVYDKVTSCLPKQKPVIKVEASGKIILASYPELSKSSINTFNLTTQAVSYISHYDYSKAIEIFDKVIKLEPENLQAWSMKGDCFLNLKDFTNAIKCYDRCIEIDPNNDAAKLNKNAAIKRRENADKKEKTDNEVSGTNDTTSAFDKIQKYIEKGKEYRDIGSYHDAIDSFDKALEINPNNITALKFKGDILLYKLGKYNESISCYKIILDKNPNALQVLKDMGLAMEKLSRYEDAMMCYDKILEINSYDEEIKKQRSIALQKQKEQKFSLLLTDIKSNYEANDFSTVIHLCEKAIAIDPETKNIIPYIYKGLSFGKLERYDEAILSFDKVLEKEQDNLQVLIEKGTILEKLERNEDAIKCYDKVLQKDPSQIHCLNGKGYALSKLEKYEDAIKCYDKVLKIDTNNIQALNGKAKVSFLLENFEGVLKLYDQILKINPNDEDTRKLKEKVIESIKKKRYASIIEQVEKDIETKNEYSKIIDLCDDAIELDPSNPISYMHKGLVLFKMEKYEESVQSYNKVLEIEPKNVEAIYGKALAFSNMGLSLFNNKKYEESLHCFDDALELSPLSVKILKYKGDTLQKLSRYDKAIQSYNKVLDIEPQNFEALLEKGRLLHQLKRYEEAIKCFDKVLEKQPYNNDAKTNKESALKALKKENFTSVLNEIKRYFDNNEFSKVVDLCNTAIEIEPQTKNITPYMYKGLSFGKLERYDEAILSFDKVLEIEPDNIRALKEKVTILENLERFEDAIKCYDRVLSVNANNEEAKRNRKIAEENLKKRKYSEIISKIEPLFHKQKDYATVITLCDKAIDIDKANHISYLYKANSLQKLSRYKEAIECYDKVLSIDANNEEAKTNKEIIQEELKKFYELRKFNFVTKWGSKGSGDGKFNSPQGIAIDHITNAIYVCDVSMNRIQKFDSNGKFITKWGSTGSYDGQFITPRRISVDSSGYVYVSDSGNHRIQKFDSNGKFITKWGSMSGVFRHKEGTFYLPIGISVVESSKNYVYVVDGSNHRIQIFDSNGKFITKWGSKGSGDGQFKFPQGMYVDSSGYVYVSDNENNRIQKFDSNGKFITKWGSEGTGDGQFKEPVDISVDSSGYVYVSDHTNRIQKFDSNGKFITKLEREVSSDMIFNASGIAIDSSGNLFLAEFMNNRILKFKID